MIPSESRGPLRGCNVLVLSDGSAAAIASWLLAEAGADVVLVSGPTPDARTVRSRRTWNRSKRSAVLDPGDAADRDLLEGMLAGADVVIVDGDDADAPTHGLDEQSMLARYPQLIVGVISWYPAEWPRSAERGDELLVQARSGAMGEVLSGDGRPTYIGFPITTWGAGLLAAAGIAAKLYDRDRHGSGGAVRTSHLQGTLYFLSNVWTEAEHAVAELQTKFGVLNRPHPWIFRCADERWIQVNVAFVDVPLVIEVLAEMGLEQPELTVDNLDEVSRFYARMFLRRPSEEWLAALHELDIDGEKLQHVGELYGDERVVAGGYTVDIDDPDVAAVRQAAVPLDLDPPLLARSPAPSIGEHTEEIRRDGWAAQSRFLARSASRSASSASSDRAPLDGLRVVDFGMNLSAPVCAKLLSDLGAEVIKVERCDGGDRLRSVHVQFAGGNRGKRSIALKLGATETRPIVEQLVAQADVVVHNLRQPKAVKLGIDYPTLAELNPRLVYAQVSGYGFNGPTAVWPARDPAVGAWSGWTLDGSSEEAGPIWLRLLIGDTGSAVTSLFGVLVSLLDREVEGRGARVRTSLLGTAAMYASETYLRLGPDDYEPIEQVNDQVTGTSPGRRIYPALDGWVAVLADQPGELEAFASAIGAGHDDLATATAALKSGDLASTLKATGIPAEVVQVGYEHEFLTDPTNVEAGLVAVYEHPQHGEMRQPGGYWQMPGARLWNRRPPPAFGQHTVEILAELGWSPARQATLADAGVVVGVDPWRSGE